MERIEVLISKLRDQFEQKADSSQMLITVQLLQAELSQQPVNSKQYLGTSKVAVMMPKPSNVPPIYSSPEFEKYLPKPAAVAEPAVTEKYADTKAAEPEEKQYNYIKSNNGSHPKRKEQGGLLFDPLVEIPTLSHQSGVMEINESVASKQESLNDRLKQQNSEVGELLKGTPIKIFVKLLVSMIALYLSVSSFGVMKRCMNEV